MGTETMDTYTALGERQTGEHAIGGGLIRGARRTSSTVRAGSDEDAQYLVLFIGGEDSEHRISALKSLKDLHGKDNELDHLSQRIEPWPTAHREKQLNCRAAH